MIGWVVRRLVRSTVRQVRGEVRKPGLGWVRTVALSLGVWLGLTVVHLVAPWWVAVVLVGLSGAAGALVAWRTGNEVAGLAVMGAGVVVALEVDLDNWWTVTLLLGTIVAARVAWGRCQGTERGDMRARFALAAERSGLPGVVLAKNVHYDELGWTSEVVHVGRSTEDVIAALPRIESELKMRRGGIRLSRTDAAHRSGIRVTTAQVHEKPVPLPDLVEGSISDLVPLGLDTIGRVRSVDLAGKHTMVAGTTGAGKSATQRVLLAHLLHMRDVEVVFVDLKAGVEAQHWERALGRHHIAEDVDEARAWLDEAVARMDEHALVMKTEKMGSTFKPSAQHPALVVIIDEAADAIDAKLDQQIMVLARKGRAMGVWLVYATQMINNRTLPTSIRGNLGIRLGHRVNSQTDSEQVFGPGSHKQGWQADQLRAGGGWMQVWVDGEMKQDQVRAFYVADRQIPEIVDSALLVHGPWPERLGDAGPLEPVQVDVSKSPEQVTLQALMDADGCSVPDLVARTGLSKATVHRHLKKLIDSGHVVQLKPGRYGIVR